ncbi:MAG: diguanylate cyclase [Gammaproteobacteria bacterium]|nr:diguanylate cyclase [Gammaproteobacteria bacterium]
METMIREKYEVQHSMLNLGQHELEEAVEELSAAIESQEQWYADLNRALICRLPPNVRDLLPEAHHLCAFGAWLDVYGNDQVRGHPLFDKINADHRQVHVLASRLWEKSVHSEKITVSDYEALYKIEKRLRRQLYQLNEELKQKVGSLDALTGLYTRKEMLDQLIRQQELVNRKTYDVSIALMDIDHFKEINDSYGHLAGDKLLAEFGRYLGLSVRVYDSVFRYGGDEFLFLLPDADIHEASEILGRLHTSIDQFEIEIGKDKTISISTSFGVASLEPGGDVEKTIHLADQALYRSKHAGRNRVSAWNVH